MVMGAAIAAFPQVITCKSQAKNKAIKVRMYVDEEAAGDMHKSQPIAVDLVFSPFHMNIANNSYIISVQFSSCKQSPI